MTTIKEAISARKALEEELLAKCIAFEKETGVAITNVFISRAQMAGRSETRLDRVEVNSTLDFAVDGLYGD